MIGWLILAVAFATVTTMWLVGERGHLMLRSTWESTKMMGWKRVLTLKSLHGYVYGRWTAQYLRFVIHHVLPRLGPVGKKFLADRYHGKVLTLEHARAIISVDVNVPLMTLSEQIIPFPKARDLVLHGPPDVCVIECGCRNARESPCQPTKVCMAIGKEFVDFAVEHNPDTARRLTQQEALDLLQAEHDRGHVHSAWFRGACADRFYAICNCCKCCCCGVENMTKYGIINVAPSGYVPKIASERCESCGTCVEACPFQALAMGDGHAELSWKKCLGCGVCVGRCKKGNIELVRDERKGVPFDVRALLADRAFADGSRRES
jgi:NAD-dependent dihydropyrimidine dehydrogenase PreA subunit